MRTLSFYKEILKVFSNIQTFSVVLIQSCCVQSKILFYLWINVFRFPLLVGDSSRVAPKRKKGTKKNETAQPAGTVHKMQQEISVL